MTVLTSQCPCAKKMRLPPRLRGETQPARGTLVVCAYCERVGVASATEPFARVATAADIPTGERTRLDELRDEAHTLYPKPRRRPLPRAVASPT